MSKESSTGDAITLCPGCNCMTHITDDGKCGKCGAAKRVYNCLEKDVYKPKAEETLKACPLVDRIDEIPFVAAKIIGGCPHRRTPAKDEGERGIFLQQQAQCAMKVVPDLLDAWDEIPNDVKSDPELKRVTRYMQKLYEVMDEPTAPADVGEEHLLNINELQNYCSVYSFTCEHCVMVEPGDRRMLPSATCRKYDFALGVDRNTLRVLRPSECHKLTALAEKEKRLNCTTAPDCKCPNCMYEAGRNIGEIEHERIAGQLHKSLKAKLQKAEKVVGAARLALAYCEREITDDPAHLDTDTEIGGLYSPLHAALTDYDKEEK